MGLFKDNFGGIISGVGGLASDLLNLVATNSTNRANMQIARETNANQMKIAQAANQMNYKLFQEGNWFNAGQARQANAFTLDMFNRANDYNSPEAQKQRLLAAGINPYSVLGDSSLVAATPQSGHAASAAAAPSAQQAQLVTPTMQAAQFRQNIGLSFLEGQKLAAEGKKANEDFKEQQMNNDHWFERFSKVMANLESQTKMNRSSSKKMDWETNKLVEDVNRMIRKRFALDEAVDKQNAVSDATVRSMNEQANKAVRETQAIGQEQDRADFLARIQERLANSTIAVNNSTIKVNNEQAKVLSETFYEVKAKKEGLQADNKLKYQEYAQAQQLFPVAIEGLRRSNLISDAEYNKAVEQLRGLKNDNDFNKWKRDSPVYKILVQFEPASGVLSSLAKP